MYNKAIYQMARDFNTTHLRKIMIGDYVDITIDNITYRCYIIEINIYDEKIIVAEMDDPEETHVLTKDVDDNYWLDEENNNNMAIFSKNATKIQYFERDFTQLPTKIITIMREKVDIEKNFTELKNGIILHESKNSHKLGFTDPSNITQVIIHVNANKKSIIDVKEAAPFLITKILRKGDSTYDIVNYSNKTYDNEFYGNEIYENIFILRHEPMEINKLDLNTLNITKIMRNVTIQWMHALKNKKILYALYGEDKKLYILHLDTDKRIVVDADRIHIANLIEFDKIYQLANEDIILSTPDNNSFYYIDIITGAIRIIPQSFNDFLDIIAVLADDTLLISHSNKSEMQIWDFINDKFTDVISNIAPFDDPITSLLLPNGDVLFHIGEFYLFKLRNKEVIPLPLTKNEYTEDRRGTFHFKQLQNSNLIVNNGKYLSILEFPINQPYYDRLNYDSINPAINSIAPDMIRLIREYL